MAVTFDKVFGVHQYTLGVRNKRAEVLAGNLANAETPGYKARDLDFGLALSQAADRVMVKKDTLPEEEMTLTNERHMDASSLPDDPELTLKYRLPYQADTGNGNTVETNSERMKYTQNTLEYQASLQFLNSRITKLMSALKSNS
ncbi:MAG: flagellar basal body rod protein FlgB [Succinivibrio sp.]|jgi:flagellar basal-body rod protein FlgB|nr:flagellar basal body rod protein FlgB [Succinivibrio sp.]